MVPGRHDLSATAQPAVRLLLIAAAVALVLFGALAVAVRELPQVGGLDRAALLALSQTRSGLLDAAMRTLTLLGSTAWIGTLAVIVGTFLRLRRNYRGMGQTLLACFGAWALMLVIKPVVGRDRPDFVQPLVEAAGFAFPSGHALMATAAYLTLAFVAQRYARRKHARILTMAFACLLILGVGGSRAYLGVHHPSDVLGGMLLGMFWAFLLEAATRKSGH